MDELKNIFEKAVKDFTPNDDQYTALIGLYEVAVSEVQSGESLENEAELLEDSIEELFDV